MADPDGDQIEKLKAAFLAIISHELRTPLTEIIGTVSLFDDGFLGPLSDEQQHYLKLISRSAAHLSTLLQDLIAFAQLEADMIEARRRPTHLNEVAQAALELHASQMEGKKLQLVRKFDPALPPLSLDRSMILRVFSNLISNAVNFTSKGGRVMLRTRGEDGYQILDIADTGIGIPKEKQARIFESFYQAEDPLTRQTGGLGIGLAYATRIVEAHRGRITFESISGKGSLFSVWLPVPNGTNEKHAGPSE